MDASSLPAQITVRLLHENVPPPEQDEAAPPPQRPKNDRFYRFWDKLTSKPPPPKRSTTPSLDRDIENKPGHHPQVNEEGLAVRENALTSFDEAAASCKSKVDAIVEECKRINEKYQDPLFDMSGYNEDVLMSLDVSSSDIPSSCLENIGVGGMKRVGDIFENPQFMIDGATANDVRQGRAGDCWFVAALTALSGTEEPGQALNLISKLCVAREEKVGVYGFVFCRDGEWVSTVIDDRLFLKDDDDKKQYRVQLGENKNFFEAAGSGDIGIEELPKSFRDKLQKTSDALYFASCRDSNETWLPLLEKAYAKAHGDYQAIEGGYVGEGIEDLTGGVTNFITTENVLDRNTLWDEFMRVNKDFLFGCHSRYGRDDEPSDEEGFVRGHAYTLLEAREFNGNRLLKIRNPWGTQEWNGAWSDGSKEWTPEAMKELKHTFGDDGIFWIKLEDMLRYYPTIDRTRLFGPEWTVIQQYTTVNVPWMEEYLDTKFILNISKPGPTVIVLAQPDSRYFKGLEGRYRFHLHFRLYKKGRDTYVLRSKTETGSGRSCSAEADLEAGTYYVHLKIDARRGDEATTPEETIRKFRLYKKDKLLSIGKSFDVTHSKGLLREFENENASRRKKEAREKVSERESKDRGFNMEVRRRDRLRRHRRIEEAKRKKAEKLASKQVPDVVDTAAQEGATEDTSAGAQTEEPKEVQEPTPGAEEPTAGSEEPKAESSSSGEAVLVLTTEESGEQAKAGEDENKTSEEAAAPEEQPAGEQQAEEQKDDESEISSVDDNDFPWDPEIDADVEELEEEEQDDIFANDAWDAVCVVGLRLYSKDPEAQITVDTPDHK